MTSPQRSTPAQSFPAHLLLKAQTIKVLFLDVDGVLTDGGLYFTETGETLKRFNTLDGHGLKLLQRSGIVPAIISGRDSPALRSRLTALGIVHWRLGTEDKVPAALSLMEELACTWREAAAMGDDWPDLPVLQRCAFSAAPPLAHPEVRSRVDHVTQSAAGHGAVRDICDLILTAQHHYANWLDHYTV